MSWPRRFAAVPTSSLLKDGTLAPSPKATPDQMRSYVQPVPDVYDRLRSGATAADLSAMRQSRDPHERAVGDTYHHLFSPLGYDSRIEAEYENGQLVVQRGRHRVEAAREAGVQYLPVHVRAADERMLGAVADRAEHEVEAAHPGTQQVQRGLDLAQRASLEATRTAERRATDGGSRASATRTGHTPQRSR